MFQESFYKVAHFFLVLNAVDIFCVIVVFVFVFVITCLYLFSLSLYTSALCSVLFALLLSNAALTSILNCSNCGVNHGLFLVIVQGGLRGHALFRAFVKTLVCLSTIWLSFFSVMVWVWFHLCFSSSTSNSPQLVFAQGLVGGSSRISVATV